MKVYGFVPTANPATLRLAHSHDERVYIDDPVFATRCQYDCIVRFCAG
jgi:acetylornithine deacetylase/succinyl-diaminopimelate desuccinylase-like protein